MFCGVVHDTITVTCPSLATVPSVGHCLWSNCVLHSVTVIFDGNVCSARAFPFFCVISVKEREMETSTVVALSHFQCDFCHTYRDGDVCSDRAFWEREKGGRRWSRPVYCKVVHDTITVTCPSLATVPSVGHCLGPVVLHGVNVIFR